MSDQAIPVKVTETPADRLRSPTLEAQWRRQCRIRGWDQETPMPPSWNHDR